jgi:mannosyl-3-phosphoglycerate phosphatase
MTSSTSTSQHTHSQAPTPAIVVMTDLDGTLLDHHSYTTKPAAPALKKLKSLGIPVIFNTSKTQDEVTDLRHDLDNTDPFVCENGSVIFIPKVEGSGFNSEVLGVSYLDIIRVLHRLRSQGYRFRGFNDMPASEVAALTGLSTDDAHLSKKRAGSEPLIWNDSDEALANFRSDLTQEGLTLTKGGRFYHVMGETNKASGVEFFRQYYQHKWQSSPIFITLGDGENDRSMLEAADYPVVIPGDKQTLTLSHAQAMTAYAKGPTGWNRAILELLEKLT